MNWDEYFLRLAQTAAAKSRCLSRQIGAVVARDNSVLSMGYNGPPRGIPHCDERYSLDTRLMAELERRCGSQSLDTSVCPRRALGFSSGHGLEWCIAAHAEANAICNAAHNGVSTKGATLYLSCDVLPCKDCMAKIINAGILEVVVTELRPYDAQSAFLFEHSKVKIREYVLETEVDTD